MISIPTRLIREITMAAKKAYPNECCGLLAGTGSLGGLVSVTKVRTSPNIATGSVKNHFKIDPKVHFDLIHELEETNERIIGHYHSHPNHPAKPSEEDLKMAFDAKLLWLIISLDENRIREVKVHKVSNSTTTFQEVPFIVAVEDYQ